MKRKRAGPISAGRAAAFTVHARVEGRYAGRARPGQLRAAAKAALAHQGVRPPAELSLVVAGDAYLRRLNRQFMGVDAPTDVLSFPSDEFADKSQVTNYVLRFTNSQSPYLGDIAISFPRARAQAAGAGHPVEHELRLLVVHGVLHLLGHDHATPAGHARMWQAQEEILKGFSQ